GGVERLKRLGQDLIVEGKVGVVDEVGVGVALDHRKPLRHAGVHAGLGELDAAPINATFLREKAEQCAIATADVEHARARRHHLGDEQKVYAARIRSAHGMRRHVYG